MVSIIIPVYNTQKFLKQCLESVLNQSYSNIEVICVNDASPDRSIDVLNSYSKKDSRIKVINKEKNEGVDRARFDGMATSSGQFLMFVDSDDWLVDNGVISHMVEKMQEYDVDYVEVGSYRCMDRNGWIKKESHSEVLGLITMPHLFDEYYVSYFGWNRLSVVLWGKLYKRSVIEKANLSPSGFAMGEDLVFNMQLFPFLHAVYISDYIGYNYRFGGMTSRYNFHLLSNLKHQFLLKENLIDQYAYDKATPYARIEIQNVLKSDICQRIIFNVCSTEELVRAVKLELEDPIWSRAQDIPQSSNYFSAPFICAIRQKDARKLIDICQNEVNTERNKRLVKRLISFLLSLL